MPDGNGSGRAGYNQSDSAEEGRPIGRGHVPFGVWPSVLVHGSVSCKFPPRGLGLGHALWWKYDREPELLQPVDMVVLDTGGIELIEVVRAAIRVGPLVTEHEVDAAEHNLL